MRYFSHSQNVYMLWHIYTYIRGRWWPSWFMSFGPSDLWPISANFEFSVIFENWDPGILNQDHRIATRTAGTRHPPAIPTARITHKALQSNFLPHTYTPPVKFFYIRRTSQVFPISRSSQVPKANVPRGTTNFRQQTSQTAFSKPRNTLIFNKNEHAWEYYYHTKKQNLFFWSKPMGWCRGVLLWVFLAALVVVVGCAVNIGEWWCWDRVVWRCCL